MKRSYPLTILIAGGLLFGAVALWAVPPEQGEGSTSFDCCQPAGFCPWDCGDGFLICETAFIDYQWKEFFDSNGDPVKYWEKQQLEGGFYEVGDPDNFVAYNPLSLTYRFDYISSDEIATGVWALVTVPGYGQIFKDVGRVVFNSGDMIFEAGDHEYWNEETDALCEYLMNH